MRAARKVKVASPRSALSDDWVLAEADVGTSTGPVAPPEAQEAKHDYAHEGYLVRLIPEVAPNGTDRTWNVYVHRTESRKNGLSCCRNKRTYVAEPVKILWEKRSTPWLRKKTGRDREGIRRGR